MLSLCILSLCMCASQCANVFCSRFLTHCPAKGLPSQASSAVSCPKQFGSRQVKQKRGFLRDSSWATVQNLKRVERQRLREGEVGAAGESEEGRVESVSKWNKLSLCPNTKDCQRQKMEKERKGALKWTRHEPLVLSREKISVSAWIMFWDKWLLLSRRG